MSFPILPDRLSWPPPYILKRSRKARSIILNISHESGLEIIMPYYCSKKNALEFLDNRKQWIIKHADDVYKNRKFQFPQHIHLMAVNKKWEIAYAANQTRNSLSNPQLQQLLYKGDSDPQSFQRIMKNWLKKQAEITITSQFRHLSLLLKLPYKSLQFRFQKSRWGSCSADADIILNSKLLFVSTKLLRYVMIHELCHIEHFDHSAAFWNKVSTYEPCYKQCIKTLKQQDKLIPQWIITKQL